MGKTLTWLHLSDLHAGKPGYDWNSGSLIHALLEDLYRFSLKKVIPDVIFFTGDLAFGNKHETHNKMCSQYEMVFYFLNAIRLIFNMKDFSRFYLVPGNHDVNKNIINPGDTIFLKSFKSWREINKKFNEYKRQQRSIMNRLNQFRNFVKSNNFIQDNYNPEFNIYSQNINNRHISINITGLNSAWSCRGEEDESDIWSAISWQVSSLWKFFTNSNLRIALAHHPINCLNSREQLNVETSLRNHFDIFLHGHIHTAKYKEEKNGIITISGGACYDRSDKKSNGYNMARLELNKTSWSGKVMYKIYAEDRNEWIGDNSVPRADNQGHVNIESRKYRNEGITIKRKKKA